MFRRLVALVVAVAFGGAGAVSLAAGDKPGPDGFISKVGTYRLYKGKLGLKIYEDKGKLNHAFVTTITFRASRFRRKEEITVSSGPSEPWIEKEAKWFAFAEATPARSPKALWIFNGRDQLTLIAYSPRKESSDPGGGFFSEYKADEYDSDYALSIVKNAPKVVRDRLPEAFKKKLQDRRSSF